MAEHAAGPWTVTGMLNDVIVASDQFEVARVMWRDMASNEAGDEHDTNARLIAAAPDLYAACESVTRWLQIPDCPLCGGMTGHCVDCPANVTAEALQHARGEA